MTLKINNYLENNPVSFISKSTGNLYTIPSNEIIEIIVKSNTYLNNISKIFEDINFNIFDILGQRNISGFIGEIFNNFFSKNINGFQINPHTDGRPDILDLTSKIAKLYYSKSFKKLENNQLPIKSNFAPFKFGGIEVKATIGNFNNYKKKLKQKGITSLQVGTSRVDYLTSITYWGHHPNCENLLGIYYDYIEELNHVPQIIAIMHSELTPPTDWNKISIGNTGSKKTSNTSLTSSGVQKLKRNPIAVLDEKKYVNKLIDIGLQITKPQ